MCEGTSKERVWSIHFPHHTTTFLLICLPWEKWVSSVFNPQCWVHSTCLWSKRRKEWWRKCTVWHKTTDPYRAPQNLAARSFAWNATCWAWEWTHDMETEMTRLMLLTHRTRALVLWSKSILPEDRDHTYLPRNPVSDTWGKSAVLFGSVILLGFIGFLCTGTTIVNKNTNIWSYRSIEFLRGKVFRFHKIMENSDTLIL